MSINNIPLDQIPVYRISREIVMVASDAQHLHDQLADLIAPNRSNPSLLRSPMVLRETALLKAKLLDIDQLLTPTALKKQPGYSEKCLSYLKEQVEVFLRNSTHPTGEEGPLDAWHHANQTLAAQAQSLTEEIARIETELIPKIVTNRHKS